MNNETLKDSKMTKLYCNNGIFTLNYNDYIDNSYYQLNQLFFQMICLLLNGKKLFSAFTILYHAKDHKLFDWIYAVTSKIHDGTLSERLYWILNDIHDFPMCANPLCNNRLSSKLFRHISDGYILYCCVRCRTSSPFPYLKAKLTASLRTDEQNKVIADKMRATKKRHAEEDPTYKDRILQKSIATRKRNHGEDYTGRKKCKLTLKDKYGVDNPMHILSVKDGLKQHNLETYGVEWHIAAPEIREKSRLTCNKNYGVDNPFASKEIIANIRQHNLETYGVEYNWQREDVKLTIRLTNRRLYGYDSAMQNPMIRARLQMNIIYDGLSFDSYPELCIYLWLVDHLMTFEYLPNISFLYIHNGNTHYYCPDFKICGLYYEVKGNLFFKDKNPADKMVCPWDHSLDALYEAKHLCMIHNHIVIITSCHYLQFIDYIEQIYGKDFYQLIKTEKQQRFNEKHKNIK